MRHSKISFLIFIAAGCFISILFLFPISDMVTFYEVKTGFIEKVRSAESATDYVFSSFSETLQGQRIPGTAFFGMLGIILGAVFYALFENLSQRNASIENMRQEIERDITSLIKKGESTHLEFKSSFRWDYNKESANKNLEHAVLKNIAAFMNTEGGSLIIGIADDGKVLGLEKDYQTLKSKNKDGFEMLIMSAIATKIGTNHCILASVLFHEIDGHEICQFLISKSSNPVYLQHNKDPKFYIRAGAGTRELNIQEATEYILRP